MQTISNIIFTYIITNNAVVRKLKINTISYLIYFISFYFYIVTIPQLYSISSIKFISRSSIYFIIQYFSFSRFFKINSEERFINDYVLYYKVFTFSYSYSSIIG